VFDALAVQRWVLKRRYCDTFLDQVRDLAADPVLAKVLYARKIDTPDKVRAFLQPQGPLGDPLTLAGVPEAVARLRQALERQEEIVVYGDYDADGVCAATLVVSALRQVGARHVTTYLPDRFGEGYGLSRAAVENLKSKYPTASLLVTVDCGIRSAAEVEYARSLGLETIVTDHHVLPPEVDGTNPLPAAVAVLNPRRTDSRYPFAELAGVGVAYRLVEALFADLGSGPDGATLDATPYLDLVALGTVADVVPLVDENRLLVRWGLERMRQEPRPGLRALIEVSGVTPGMVNSGDVGYRLGPRINAAGRLETAQLALDLLSAESQETALPLARKLDEQNRERQRLLEAQVAIAQGLLGEVDGQKILLVAHAELHEGIVGLVASRLVEHYCRPALVMRRGEDTTKGSARSIEGFHITEALDACGHLFERYGGHARAAGFTVRNENLDALRDELTRYADEHLDASLLCPQYHVDARVALDELGDETPHALAALGPFGEGNPEPALATQGLVLKVLQPVGRENQHLRMQVTDGKRYLSAIAFGKGPLAQELHVGDAVDLIYRPEIHEWRGDRSLQLTVRAIRPSRGA